MSNPVDFYLKQITSEYQNSPKYLGMVEEALTYLDNITQLADSMYAYFSLEEIDGIKAEGAQLDALGQIVGAPRTVPFQPSGSPPGNSVLDDATYRILIKATIAANQWDGCLASLQPTWNILFPQGTIIIQDNQDMTFTVKLAGNFTPIIKDLIRNGYIVPRPEGVLMLYNFGEEPYLGWDRQDGQIAGWDTGNWT